MGTADAPGAVPGLGGSPSFRYHQSQAQSLVSLSCTRAVARNTLALFAHPVAPALPLAACTRPPACLPGTQSGLCAQAPVGLSPHTHARLYQAPLGTVGSLVATGGTCLLLFFLKQVIDLLVISFHRDIPCP